jgi:RNA polymerase sigma-70 factor (ECF subfamily)
VELGAALAARPSPAAVTVGALAPGSARPRPGGEAPAVSPSPFEAFYRAESTRILAVVAALTGDWGAAEDIVQEAFAAAYRRWDTVGRFDRPGAWVRRVAINQAISRARRRAVETRVLARIGLGPDAHDDEPMVEAELWTAVRRLPRRQAQAVALAYAGDLGIAEIAAVLGCGEGSVKTHLRRARERLAREVPDPRADPDADAGARRAGGGDG